MRDRKNVIVTLMYDKPEFTKRLLLGLSANEAENIDRVLVVDNGSTPENSEDIIGFLSLVRSFGVSYHRLNENIGFTLGANYGIKNAMRELLDDDLIFLISNDVQINGKFIDKAKGCFVIPHEALVGNRHINWDSGWNKFNGKVFDYLEGYFLVATSLGWEGLGYFDENYAPCDFEDVDLTTKAKELGYKIISLNNPNIIHAGAGTIGYNPEREAITRRNQEYFKKKWVSR